ncbi:hypothetical protein ACFVHA_29030, partial [Bacillus cereus]|uniref:hypothetical protein n=1 Tax=Bacillus cereus TaxID=1396 RepID=UPI00363F6C66
MARTAGTFGTVERLSSGQWRARYRHQGKRHTAPEPFDNEDLARGYLASVKFTIAAGSWLPPAKANPKRPDKPRPVPTFAEFAESWITKRETGAIRDSKGKAMRPRTAAEYRRLAKMVPKSIAATGVDAVTPSQITGWYDALCAAERPTQTARAYAFVRTVFA